MEHPAFRKFNEQETFQIAQMSESLLFPRQIQAQLCSQRESDRLVNLQDIYNQVKKIKQNKLQGRRPIDALIDNLKQEKFVWSSARDSEGHITSLFIYSFFELMLSDNWLRRLAQVYIEIHLQGHQCPG
ncbi:hypothetical protein O181_082299 [Austropuccinia psidii MF-1]|uniref:Uncharacterized protein n=1 Tax=Austropuccinia psidii MF-1 TaxID=1389203 RepID=A0A9Q3FPF4_9BASI|nr:hypothetical protein [Austropuccinia psidii MF-1]